MKRIILVFLSFSIMFSIGCLNIMLAKGSEGTESEVENLGYMLAPKEESCKIDFYRKDKPSSSYEEIAKITTHVRKNLILSQDNAANTALAEELRKQTCKVGGEAVIINNMIKTHSSEIIHLHTWSTVIIYK